MSSKEFDNLYDRLKNNPLPINEGLATLRESYKNMVDKVPLIYGSKFKKVDINGVSAEWVTAPAEWLSMSENFSEPIIMYLHGGGYIINNLEIYHYTAAKLSAVAGMSVLLADYKISPENKFPAALNDSITIYKWLLEQGYKAEEIIIMGDDAGGGLTLSTLLKIRSLGLKMPSLAICISPLTDLAQTGKSIQTNAETDPMMSYEFIKFCADCYVGEEGDRCDPFASPFYADLSGLPPMLIMVGSKEILLDDSVRFARKAEFFGVDAKLVIAQDMLHSWTIFAGMIPEGQQAIQYIGDFIHKNNF